MYSAVTVIAICMLRLESIVGTVQIWVRFLNETITHLRACIALLRPVSDAPMVVLFAFIFTYTYINSYFKKERAVFTRL